MSLFKSIAVLGILATIFLPSVPSVQADSISANDREKLDKLLTIVSDGKQGKSVTRKIGQMVMVGFRGTTSKHRGTRAVMQQLKEGSIGGVMLMKHNIVSMRQVKKLTATLRSAARAGNKAPPLISVDQEGGLVQRLQFNKFPSAKAIGSSSLDHAAKVYNNLACEVRSAGINVNFGPVVDVDVQGRKNPVIGRLKRSYSSNPTTVGNYAHQFVQAHKNYGVITAAKHFPGHGSSLKDSHKGFTAIPHWNSKKELAPFKALVKASPEQSIDMVMVGHLYNKSWKAPATLSRKAIFGLLRKDVNFRGVVITDDMEMGAIRKNYQWHEAVISAVWAGNDILLYANTVTHDPSLGPKIRDTIAGAVCKKSTPKGTRCISAKQIDDSFNRILAMKYNQVRQAAYNNNRRCIGLRKK